MLLKLESLYMKNSLDHKLCLKQQFYSFRMVEIKSNMEKLAKYHKIVDDLENINEKIKDEDKTLLL